MNKIKIILWICATAVQTVFAQLPMGGWQTHSSFSNTTLLEETPERIFAISSGSLFSIGKAEYDLQTYTKVNGLNGSDVAQIKYDNATAQLIIVYSNGNIDLLSKNGIVNVPDFYRKQMSVAKTVNHIFCHHSNAYLSTDFGIVVLNLKKYEISDTYYFAPNSKEVKTLATTFLNGKIYAATSENIYCAPENANLVDFQQWTTVVDLPGSGEFQTVAAITDYLLIQRGNYVYRRYINDTQWGVVAAVGKIKITPSFMYLFLSNQIGIFDFANDWAYSLQTVAEPISDFLKTNNRLWCAAGEQGLGLLEGDTWNFFKPDGPGMNSIWQMRIAGNKLIAIHGGREAAQYMIPAQVSIMENSLWQVITNKELTEQTQKVARDFVDIAIDPKDNNHFFISSYGTGLYEFRNNALYAHHTLESTGGGIEAVLPNLPDEYTRLNGLAFDSENNLLVSNAGVSTAIRVLTHNGQWKKLDYPEGRYMETPGIIEINTQYPSQKWAFSLRLPSGILVFDDAGTSANLADDKSQFFKSFNYLKNNEITVTNATYFYCFAQDRNGTIWIGTDQGPLLFNNTQDIFNTNYLCSKVLIPRQDSTGLGDFLLEGVRINAIAVDGANRKWLGTESSGVYLVSANGLETIAHFTAENSPLPANNVKSIVLNAISGEVFFGTTSGIASYQSDASEPMPDFSAVSAYPNPVERNFEGVVTISGLVENSLVRITDLASNVVFETTSNGSIATWNLRNNYGNRVSTGVYFVMVVSADGTLYGSTKILVFQ